jgi:hypothetical protein
MNQDEVRLRTLLIDIGDRLSNENRVQLCFILRGEVPTRDLDTVARDSHASMNVIWEALINRQKITPDNLVYLITCFERIGRIDLAQRLRQYSTAPRLGNSVERSNNASELFVRHDPPQN